MPVENDQKRPEVLLDIEATLQGLAGGDGPSLRVVRPWRLQATFERHEPEEVRVPVAAAAGWVIDLGELIDHPPEDFSLEEVMDAEAAELGELYRACIDPRTERLKEKIEPFLPAHCLVHVASLSVQPPWRGQGIGLVMLAHVSHLIGHDQNPVTLIAWPEGLDPNSRAFGEARKRLERYFARLGFRRLPRTRICWLDPTTQQASWQLLFHRTRKLYLPPGLVP